PLHPCISWRWSLFTWTGLLQCPVTVGWNVQDRTPNEARVDRAETAEACERA
ncbi:hypothetical protein BC831DRAFT_474214, partial [Entophlyctis helioformis]